MTGGVEQGLLSFKNLILRFFFFFWQQKRYMNNLMHVKWHKTIIMDDAAGCLSHKKYNLPKERKKTHES